MKNAEPQFTSCGSTPGRSADGIDAERRGQRRRRIERRAEHRLLLRHPRKLQPVALPFQFDERRPDAEANVNSFRPGAIAPSSASANVEPITGWPGELHFVRRTEDAQADVGAGRLGRLDERAFRELRFARHRLHLARRSAPRFP